MKTVAAQRISTQRGHVSYSQRVGGERSVVSQGGCLCSSRWLWSDMPPGGARCVADACNAFVWHVGEAVAAGVPQVCVSERERVSE